MRSRGSRCFVLALLAAAGCAEAATQQGVLVATAPETLRGAIDGGDVVGFRGICLDLAELLSELRRAARQR